MHVFHGCNEIWLLIKEVKKRLRLNSSVWMMMKLKMRSIYLVEEIRYISFDWVMHIFYYPGKTHPSRLLNIFLAFGRVVYTKWNAMQCARGAYIHQQHINKYTEIYTQWFKWNKDHEPNWICSLYVTQDSSLT